MLKGEFFIFRKGLNRLFLLFFIVLIGNFYLIKAQETKEDRCIRIYETFGKTFDELNKLEKGYVECGGSKIIDQFFPTQVEGFGITNLEYEWARLDILSTMLNNNSELLAYIVIYGGKVNKYGELKERPKPLVHYLINKKGIDPKRIRIIEGGFREKFEFELWTSPSDKIFPPLTPTVSVEKVIFRGKMKPLPLDLDYYILNKS